jgi:hypothetical protein
MARKKSNIPEPEGETLTPAPEAPSEAEHPPAPAFTAKPEEENVSAYFKKLFDQYPHLLKKRSNDEVYELWRRDHPGYTEIPKKVQQGLSNVKSLKRNEKKRPGRARKPREEPANGSASRPLRAAPAHSKGLEKLEEMIDECLSLARSEGREELEPVIQYLRKARKEIIVKLGP